VTREERRQAVLARRAAKEQQARLLKQVETAVAVAVLANEVKKATVPPRRDMTEAEKASQINFDAIETRRQEISQRLLALTDPIAEHIISQLPLDLAGAVSVREVSQRLHEFRSPITGVTITGLAAVVAAVTEQITRELQKVWKPAAAAVIAEAIAQGVPSVPATTVAIPVTAQSLITGDATAIATYRAQRLMTVAASVPSKLTVPELIDDIAGALKDVDPAGTLNLARQGVHHVEMAARGEQLDAEGMPEITVAYASEILDSRTCDECERIDGTEYSSMEEALADYPGETGYIGCEGDCRGMLVTMFNTDENGISRAGSFKERAVSSAVLSQWV
jgi:hypothetical protein